MDQKTLLFSGVSSILFFVSLALSFNIAGFIALTVVLFIPFFSFGLMVVFEFIFTLSEKLQGKEIKWIENYTY